MIIDDNIDLKLQWTTGYLCKLFFVVFLNSLLWPSRQQSVHLLHQPTAAPSTCSVGIVFGAWRAVLRLWRGEDMRELHIIFWYVQLRNFFRFDRQSSYILCDFIKASKINLRLTLWTRRSLAPAIMAASPVWAGESSPWLPPPMGNGGGRGGWGAPAEGGGGPGGGGGGGGPPPMFIGGGMTGGATESTAGWPWKGEPGDSRRPVKMEDNLYVAITVGVILFWCT